MLGLSAHILVLLSASVVFAQYQPKILGPYSAAANFAVDIAGEKDERPYTWGTAGAEYKRITFKPPTGYRVRILRVYGDLITGVRGKVPPGQFAYALLAMQSTAVEGSVRADLAADNTFLYIQTPAVPATRAPFDFDTSVGGLLEEDNVLVVKVAVFLSDVSVPVHLEPSFTVVFRFEKASE